jgi:putative spermidine/putrescine transport system ATP-binding protein
VRPEKIYVRMEDDPVDGGVDSETGTIRDVVYVGMVTRYVVELYRGGELMVVRQNLETSSQDALEERGRRVRLEWRPEHTYRIEPPEEESR